MIELLQNLLDGAYALRWPIVVVLVVVMGCFIAILVGDRDFLLEENAELRAENADLRAKRARAAALRPRRTR